MCALIERQSRVRNALRCCCTRCAMSIFDATIANISSQLSRTCCASGERCTSRSMRSSNATCHTHQPNTLQHVAAHTHLSLHETHAVMQRTSEFLQQVRRLHLRNLNDVTASKLLFCRRGHLLCRLLRAVWPFYRDRVHRGGGRVRKETGGGVWGPDG